MSEAGVAEPVVGTARVKRGMAEMLKGGVIMDVVTPEQAKIAEDAGAVAVMALERVPADIATPADAAMMMQLGADGVFVGSGIFKSGNPAKRAEAIVKATTFYDDPDVVAKVSRGLGEAMVGINVEELPQPHRLAERGW